MFEDNKACITIALQESSTRKTKHVELQVHHIRYLVKTGRINMIHITTNIQLADIFTKPLTDEVLPRHLPVILGGEPSGDLQVISVKRLTWAFENSSLQYYVSSQICEGRIRLS